MNNRQLIDKLLVKHFGEKARGQKMGVFQPNLHFTIPVKTVEDLVDFLCQCVNARSEKPIGEILDNSIDN